MIEVRNGKGILREVYGGTKQASFMTLMFGDKPLFQLQGKEFFQNRLNENVDNLSFLEAVEGIKPILGLLKSGYYIIVETRLYPTAEEAAALDIAGDNPENKIQRILDGESFADIQYLIKALVILKHPRTRELADYLMHQEKYLGWRYSILKEMTKMEKTEEMEKWMLDIMIEFEDDYPEIRELILDYL